LNTKTLTFTLALIVTGLSGCSTLYVQPQEKPNALFKNTTVHDVQSKLAAFCVEKGNEIDEQTTNSLVCGNAISGGKEFALQLAYGGGGASPRAKLRFNLGQVGPDVKVTAGMSMEVQNPGGQTTRIESTNDNDRKGLQQTLDKLSGSKS
jgi:hypothetical protein